MGFRLLCGVFALVVLSGRTLPAQFFRAPVFIAQPGVITVEAVSSENPFGSSTGLVLRFVTVIPTASKRLNLMVGASFAPLGLNNGRDANNDPVFFYGASFPILRPEQTGGWFGFSMPLLGIYQYDFRAETRRLYEQDLMLEGALSLHLGRKMMSDMGDFWSNIGLYLIADQSLTPNRDPNTHRIDRFNPTFMYGVTIPIAGERGSIAYDRSGTSARSTHRQ